MEYTQLRVETDTKAGVRDCDAELQVLLYILSDIYII
jgi:hypothetical protein